MSRELKAKYNLSKVDVVEIALAGIPAVPSATFAIMKSADVPDGKEPIIKSNSTKLFKVDEVKKQVMGYVLVPDTPDLQGDVVSKEDVEKAAHSYLTNGFSGDAKSKGTSTNHDIFKDIGTPIESAIDTDGSIGKAAGVDGVPGGWWVGIQIEKDETWTQIEKGEFTGFSIGGFGVRTPVEGSVEKTSNESAFTKVFNAVTTLINKGEGDAVSFDEARAEQDNRDKLWDMFGSLERSVYSVLDDKDVDNKQDAIAASIDQFKAAMVAFVAVSKAISDKRNSNNELLEKLSVAVEPVQKLSDLLNKITIQKSISKSGGSEMSMEEQVKELTKTVEGLVGRVDKAEEANKVSTDTAQKKTEDEGAVKKTENEQIATTLETLTKTVGDLSARLTKFEETPGTRSGDEPDGTPEDVTKNMTKEQKEEYQEKQLASRFVFGGSE